MRLRSLRTRLAVLSAVAGLVPLVVLLIAVFVFETDAITVRTEDVEQEIVTGDRGLADLITTEETGVSTFVPLTASLLVLPVVAMAWWWASRAVRPIVEITEVASDIQGSTLDRRIALDGAPDEVQALGDSFDAMLDRLSATSDLQRRMLEDTNHELRTPLSALRINNEVMLADPDPTLAAYRAHVERTHDLIDRIEATVESHLSAARTEQLASQQVDNDLMVIVHETATEAADLRPDVTVEIAGPDHLIVPIESAGMRRAIRNLLDNAVRASPAESVVSVAVSADTDQWSLSVTDAGPGIDAQDHDRIFDRYYTTHPDGSVNHGIGLAVVKQVALAHGDIRIQSPVAETGVGTRFQIVAPLDQGAAGASDTKPIGLPHD